MTKPFIKWVGGKRAMVGELLSRLPATFSTYHEPFLGGGTLYFALQPHEAYLSDISHVLVGTYCVVRDDVERLIEYLQFHKNNHSKDYYLSMREQLGEEKDATRLAAIFIYINKTCYNGLYRVNKNGDFNVPMGDYKKGPSVDARNLRECSQALKLATVHAHSFEQCAVLRGGFYYLDPPYHEKYSKYSAGGFSEQKQRDIVEYCKRIDKEGAYFMLSNSDTPLIWELYHDYCIEAIHASRSVSCKSEQRKKERELIIRNYSLH